MTVDLLANRKHLNESFESFVYAHNAIYVIWRLTLGHALGESLELKFLCKNIAFILNNKKK